MVVIVAALGWSWRETEVDPLTGAVSADRRDRGPNRSELAALEHALRLAERWDAQVVAATVGPAEADAMLRDALAAGAAQGLRVEPASWTAAPRPAGLVGGEQESAAALAAALRQHYGVPDSGAMRRPSGRPGHRLIPSVPGCVTECGAGPGLLAAGARGRPRAAGAPTPRRRSPRSADGAAACRRIGRGGRGTAAACRAAGHPGQRERRDHGGRHVGRRRGAADPGAGRTSVPAPAARACRSVRFGAAKDAGAHRSAGRAHPAHRAGSAVPGTCCRRTARVPASPRLSRHG